jgi:hypothetical protein
MYDAQEFQLANPINRFAIRGPRDLGPCNNLPIPTSGYQHTSIREQSGGMSCPSVPHSSGETSCTRGWIVNPGCVVPTNDNRRDQNRDLARYNIGMRDRRFSKHIEGMLDVMLCLPRYAWGFVLIDVDKKIGTVALQKIILRACEESGSQIFERFKRTVALFNRKKKRKRAQWRKMKAPVRGE